MIFKEIETDQEWSRANDLRNLYNWTNPIPMQEGRESHARSKAYRKDVRLIGIENDKIVSYTMVFENISSPNKDFWFALHYDPKNTNARQAAAAAVQQAMETIASLGGSRGMIESRSEIAWESSMYDELGFTMDMRLPFSGLDVLSTDFDPQPEVVTFAEFLAANPDNGIHKIWRCEMECAADLPLPFPFVETPFELFAERVTQDPNNDLNSKFLFYEDGELKGLSTLDPSKVNTKLAQTGITGVRRQFRRQGVARRLKQHVIAWSKARGIEQIFADNEENNPMYQLNLQLGFRHMFDYEVYSKSC